MAVAVVVLAFVDLAVPRTVAWVALPLGTFAYLIMGHAPIHGWFLWVEVLRDLLGSARPKR